MRVDAFVTQPHYVSHLAPIWFGLGEARHSFYVAGLLADTSNGEGIPGWRIGHPPAVANLLTLVAGAQDELDCPRPTIYVEHGAGQTYPGDSRAANHEAYNGTPGHDRTRLFLSPSETVAERWRHRYPHVQVAAVGCPKLDAWHRLRPPWPSTETGHPTVAITFHSNNVICPETVTAWEHYKAAMPATIGRLRREGFGVLGHGHPRLWAGPRGLRAWWDSLGVETADTFDEVIARADILCVDNSSAGPEFASLDRPIVWMNAPWYRRDVSHGGRFWEWTEGIETADEPDRLVDAIMRAVGWPDSMRAAHERMVEKVYVATDGRATERALEAIMGLDATGVYAQGRARRPAAAPVRVPGQSPRPSTRRDRQAAQRAAAEPTGEATEAIGSDGTNPERLQEMVGDIGGRHPAEGGTGHPGVAD